MNVPGSTEDQMSKDKNSEHEPHLESTEVILIHCNVVNNIYHQNSTVLYTFVSRKLSAQLLKISPTNFTFFKTLNTQFFVTATGLEPRTT